MRGKTAFLSKLQKKLRAAIEPKILGLVQSYQEAEFDHPDFGKILKEEGKTYAKSVGDPRHAIYFMEKAVFQVTDETRQFHLRKKMKVFEVKKDRHFKNMLEGMKIEDGKIKFKQCHHDCYGDETKPKEAEKEVEIYRKLKQRKRKRPVMLSKKRSFIEG